MPSKISVKKVSLKNSIRKSEMAECNNGESCTPVALIAQSQVRQEKDIKKIEENIKASTQEIQKTMKVMSESFTSCLADIQKNIVEVSLVVENHTARLQEGQHTFDEINKKISSGQSCFTQIKTEQARSDEKILSARQIAEAAVKRANEAKEKASEAKVEAAKKTPAASNKKVVGVGVGAGGGIVALFEFAKYLISTFWSNS